MFFSYLFLNEVQGYEWPLPESGFYFFSKERELKYLQIPHENTLCQQVSLAWLLYAYIKKYFAS